MGPAGPAACSRNQLYNLKSLYSQKHVSGGDKMWTGGGAWFIIFQVKIYLYIQTKNVVIHCTSGKVASNIGILETVFCLVNGSLEDIENKMEG